MTTPNYNQPDTLAIVRAAHAAKEASDARLRAAIQAAHVAGATGDALAGAAGQKSRRALAQTYGLGPRPDLPRGPRKGDTATDELAKVVEAKQEADAATTALHEAVTAAYVAHEPLADILAAIGQSPNSRTTLYRTFGLSDVDR